MSPEKLKALKTFIPSWGEDIHPECDDGWAVIIQALLCSINNVILRWWDDLSSRAGTTTLEFDSKPKFPRISQIKEKFGELRVCFDLPESYPENLRSDIYNLLENYENKSTTICEFCGEVGKLTIKQKGYWIKTVCGKCKEW